MAYLLVILLISLIDGGEQITGGLIASSMLDLVIQLGVGTATGLIIGYLTVKVVNILHSSNEFLYPVLVIACCFFTFAVTNFVGGNSYLAVYIAGLVVGNSRLSLAASTRSSWRLIQCFRSWRMRSGFLRLILVVGVVIPVIGVIAIVGIVVTIVRHPVA